MNIEHIIQALDLCRQEGLRDQNIDIALGKYKAPESWKEVRNYLNLRYGKKDS